MENIREEVATINQQTLYKSTFDSNNQESYSVVEYKKSNGKYSLCLLGYR